MTQTDTEIFLKAPFELSPEEALPFLNIVNCGITGPDFTQTYSTVRHIPLSFYEGNYSLVMIDETSPEREARGRYILNEDRLLPFDGSLEALLALNAENSLSLTEETLPLYIRFYLAVLDGPQFELTESLSEHPDTLFMDDATQKQASVLINPVQIMQTESGFEATTVLFHEGKLYQANMQIADDGHVTMTGDRELPLKATRPVLDDDLSFLEEM